MFPPRTPLRIQNAHKSMTPFYEFFKKYERWIGYLRAALTGSDDMVERALPIFAAVRREMQSSAPKSA